MSLLREASQRALRKLEIEGVWLSPEQAMALRDIVTKVEDLSPEQAEVHEKLIKRCRELESAAR